MGCVNKSSKEFKNLATRHNLDSNALELIVHEYWLETGNETVFPTDIYIQSKLGNASYQEDGENVRKLWQMRYSSPMEFSTLEECMSAYEQATQYFPKSAMTYYKNAKGNYVLSVKKPVKKVNHSKDSFFAKADRMAVTDNDRTINLGIEENQTYGLGKIQDLYNRFNTDRTSKDLADRVFDIAQKLNLHFTFNDEFAKGKLGRYVNDNTITYRKSFFESEGMNDLKAPVILHELLHAVSMYALSDEMSGELSKPLQKFKVEMNSLYQDLKTNPLLKGELGITNVNEFVAELSNPVFRAKIQEIDKQNKSKKNSFWGRVLDTFKHLLGLHVTNSYYERSMNALDKALDALDLDTYMRYNQVKNQLRNDISGKKAPKNSKARRFLSSLLPSQRKEEGRLIKREEADYDLVNGIEEAPQRSKRTVPQDFTFDDGTTIKAPFKPNEQQEEALNAMDTFIKSKDTSMTLSGYAGTGKTSLMEMIAKKARMQGKPVMFCATTNKAAAVLNDRVSKAGFKASTLNKTFGINVEVDSNQKSYNARNLVNVLKDVDIMPGTTIIIDEASMINEENYKVLNDIAEENRLKIIYVGDEAQLAPVNEDQVSKVFRNGDGKVITLTQVERTDDNAILKEATNIRNGEPLSGVSSFNNKGEGVAYISSQNKSAINEVIDNYAKGLKRDPNYFKILAYTNKAVADYNSQVRTLLGYTSPIPQVGEPMTGYANWGYDWRTKSYRFINSESYKVTNVGKPRNKSILLDDGRQLSFETYPITLEDSMGHKDEFEFMDIKSNPQNRQAAMVLADEKKKLWAMTKKVYGRQAKAEIFQKINALDSFLFVNDNIEDNNHNLLQAKTIDFGYALTIHKSQGSTFTNVLMDDVDVSKAARSNSLEAIDLGEGVVGDPTKATLGSSEDVDLGDLSDTTTGEDISSPAVPNKVANIKQQLEYVGVSRATDTVTIISNKVKKEGSPLHPNEDVKEDTINENDNRSNNVNNNNVNNGTEYKATDEFRRVQEAVRGSGKEASRGRSVFEGNLTPDQRQRLANVLGRQLGSIDSFIHGSSRDVVNQMHGTSFNIHSEVNPTLFHDIFEVTRYYTKNGELVDLHDDYSDCKCYLSEDGTAGFAIEPDGTLVSVFNLGIRKGFLGAIKDLVREEGATHLDAYASSKQNLEQMYEKTLGFHTAATMDYNMEYDHDDIAKNHGNPQVVFMVDHEVEEPKHFDKDSYDEAKNYQMTQLKDNNNEPEAENPTFEEGKTFKVKLPGYEYFNDLYEDSTVDAEWKIPYLQELDSQLSTDESEEENQDIINQMNTIMNATSEKEYTQQQKDPKGVKKTLSEYDKFIQQLDNLLEGGNEDYKELGFTIPASEVRHTAELIINEVSDEITRLQTEEGRAKEIFPLVNTDLDFLTATRRQIVDAIGINNLLDRVKYLFDSETALYEVDVTSFQADLITDNWDAFITMAADIFALNEGFGITKDYTKGNFTTTDQFKVDYDNFNDYSNDQDVVAEEGEKDEQEHWQVEMKTIDVLNSMSALVRQGLRECYLLNEDGSKVMSKWGIAERVNPRKATNSILRWTQGSLSLDDMVNKLSERQSKNPWLSQLITKLTDKSGKYTDFQSQFYGVFSKHFQPYSIVLQEDGKYHSIMVNSHPALTDALRAITSKYKVQEHPLFNGSMVRKDVLGSEGNTGTTFTLHKALTELQAITKSLNEGKTLDDEMSNQAKANILGVCRILGYDVEESTLADILNADTIKKSTMYLNFMVKDLDKVYTAQHQGKLKDYNPFKFGQKNGIDGSLRNFLTPITEVLEDTAVSAFYDSGKMYQSYITPSFMTKLMNKFRQTGQKFEDFMMDEYASSEWFAFDKYGDFNRIQWRNSWLRLLQREDARKVFDHKVELNFNKHNYMRNMTDAEYTLSLITEYFAENTDKSADMAPAWFRIPMQSNKPSSDFIKFYSYRGSTYKTSIVNNLHDMFLQELSRIQTVRMRKLSKGDIGFIKNFDTNGRKFNFLPVFNAYLENTPAAMAQREQLHNQVEFDETRLAELQLREEEWKRGDILGVFEDQDEYNALKALKDANDRALTTAEDNTFASLLQKKLKGEEALTAEEEVEFGNLADKIIRQYMENRVQSILDTWEENGILKSAEDIKGIYPASIDEEGRPAWVREQVENFLWNDALASKNILQLTIGDIAFYKDTEDLQKRLAQLHAPGVRGRIDATDYNGKRVSDGKYRTFVLKDFDTFKSNIIANISEVFDRKIAAAPDSQKPAMIALKESLVGKDGKYTQINVTDAQGYSSPTSYRKKAFIFGRWSHQAEDIYQKLRSGKYTFSDLETAFQPLKPFVYTKLTKNLGVSNAPIHSMQVPFQAKNAEYLLIMADAILKGEQLSRPNLLRAVYRVMEDSSYDDFTHDVNGRINNLDNYNGKGIDTVQFESAIKSGLQGTIDISQFMDMPGGENAAYEYMMNKIYKEESDAQGNRVHKNYDTDVYVHETSFDDYCIQQEVPEHFKGHSQAHGSQIRMITPSDLDLFTTDENGNQVDNYYTWKEPDGTVKKLKADEFRKEYEQTIADNIEESIDNLVAELHLDALDKRERNIALSKILIKEILSSPRYGVDLMQACSLNSDGEFRIPKGDPIQAKRIEQLINSIIKNRINKQKIAGGPIVQVSNFGTSKQLHIRFNDKQGNLIPLESEYNPSEHEGLSYKDYLKKHQGGIAYFEVFAPIWSNDLYDKFSNVDGTINIDAIEALDPELLKMVSYRIPTEDKYSCAPMKVVGFMPREAGDAIMLPYELTEIDDSDFDVDKRYVMRKDIPITYRSRKEVSDILFDALSESYKKAHEGHSNNRFIADQVGMFMDNPKLMRNTSKLMQFLWRKYQTVAYQTEAPTSGRGYRDNKIIDMTYAVLTNEMTADKILNPGGFDAPKKMGYMVAAYKNPANANLKWSDLEGMSIDELKKLSYTDKDLTFADTQVQFYKQNSAAASLIGVFAVNKVAHATLESNGVYLDVLSICGDKPFAIADTVFGGKKTKDAEGNDILVEDPDLQGKMEIDMKYDQDRTLIGKTLGSLVSASADAVKDPILNLMNVNMTTAGMLNTMLRFGMPFNDAALFLSQDIIERLLNQFNRENLTNYVSLDSLITKWLDAYSKRNGVTESSALNTEPLTREELVAGLKPTEHEEIDYKVLLAFQKMRVLTDYMRKPTFVTRFNSISSAVGPLIIDNLILEHKMQQFTDTASDSGTQFFSKDETYGWVKYDITDTFTDHPILQQFSRSVNMAEQLFHDMPTGSTGFRNLLNELPKDISDKMYGDKKLLDQLSNFYQSYLLIQSGVVDPSRLEYYIKDFPKEFISENYAEKYPDNALIKAIRMNVNSKTNNPYLMINITGMDEQQKEELKYGWVDLHKVDPQLSQDLFNYSFFRAGIGFSPKTFMALVPTYVKERLKSTSGNASYVDTYRNFPEVVPELVINQFIRNNWSNNKLAPWRGGKDTHYVVDTKNGTLMVTRPEEVKDVKDFSYIKTSINKVAYLWHQEGQTTDGILFRMVKPLGNNGEYLEMNTSDIVYPMAATAETSQDNTPSPMKEVSPQESSADEVTTPIESSTQEAKNLGEIANLIMKQVPKFNRQQALDKAMEIRDRGVNIYAGFLQNVFKQKGLELDRKAAVEEFKKYC